MHQKMQETRAAAHVRLDVEIIDMLFHRGNADDEALTDLLIGEAVGREYGVMFLPSDFKKKNGYKRSIELSREFGLYRQNFCGCAFSKREAINKENKAPAGSALA